MKKLNFVLTFSVCFLILSPLFADSGGFAYRYQAGELLTSTTIGFSGVVHSWCFRVDGGTATIKINEGATLKLNDGEEFDEFPAGRLSSPIFSFGLQTGTTGRYFISQ